MVFQNRLPYRSPDAVAVTTTREQYAKVFLGPITPLMTSMLGRESAGPASRRARAGPLPIPAPRSPSRIGTSVKVAKYMKAPTTAAKKLAPTELPPTSLAIHSEGMSPSWPGRPSSSPAAATPARRSGRICLANPHDAPTHSESSSVRNQRASMKASSTRKRPERIHLTR